jgi:hypothetical protein
MSFHSKVAKRRAIDMKDEKILTASDVLKMLERPVVIAYGRETFNRLLKNQRHTMICTRYPDDIGVLKWCADFLFRRKGVGAYFDYEKTKYGQTICYLVAGWAGVYFSKAEYYLRILREDHDFLIKHKYDFPPEKLPTVEDIIWGLEDYITQLEEDLIYDFEDAYNTHLWKPTVSIEYACDEIQSLINEIDRYSEKKQIYELRQYIQAKER